MATFLILVGGLLVALVLADVFFTVFHPTAHAGPLTRLQSRAVWRVTRMVGGCGGHRNDRILTLGGPAIAALTPVLWVTLLVLGFAFIQWPFVLSFAYGPVPPQGQWLEAFYYSGYLATTLGLGDVVPTTPLFRVLAIVEAFIGFGLFSVGITYVLSIYTQQSVQTALADDIQHALEGADTLDWEDPGEHELDWSFDLARDFAHRLARVTTANSQYPILHYFRHRNADKALPVQVGRLIRWVRAVEAAPREQRWLRGRSPFLSLRRALDDYLREVPTHLVPGGQVGTGKVDDVDWDRQHRWLLEYLCYDGVAGEGREKGRES